MLRAPVQLRRVPGRPVRPQHRPDHGFGGHYAHILSCAYCPFWRAVFACRIRATSNPPVRQHWGVAPDTIQSGPDMPDRTCTRCATPRDLSDFYVRGNGKINPWCKSCYRQWHRNRYQTASVDAHDAPRPCAWCGLVYIPKQRRTSKCCSRICKDSSRNSAAAAARLAAKPIRNCLHCSASIPPEKFISAAFCSTKCSNAAHNVTRKMRKRASDPGLGLISRAEIAERDGWRCGLCRRKVNQLKVWPDPMCASIDHVLPLARGGDNSSANLQLAHLRCNLSKRADGRDQLRLF